MAQYSALWTSARDPEYLQMKKVKQLTERRLAMDITQMEKNYKRRVSKTQEQIRENQDILEVMEKEKETRARHILATYHRHQRMKAMARRFIGKFRMIKESKAKQQAKDHKQVTPQSVNQLERLMTQTPGIRHRVLMVHTFPYVYHSHGDKPCPRYDKFHESTEYGPPEVTSDGRIPRASLLASKRNSVDRLARPSVTISTVPTLPPILEKSKTPKSKVQSLLTAFRAVGALSKR